MDLQQLPKNDILWTAFNMYQASDSTRALKTEKHRVLFAENFETSQVQALSSLCLKVIARSYKGLPINLDIKPFQLRIFYDEIDADMPLEKCIHIDDEYYWKRVYASKCTDKISLKEKTNDKDVCWKNLAITRKYVELIESTPYEIWINDVMIKTTQMVSPYVTELHISKLQAMRDATFYKIPVESDVTSGFTISDEGEEEAQVVQEEQEEENDEHEFDFRTELCHHVDLRILSNLHRLHSLTVEFLPPELGINYHERYFKFSYVDVQNLSRAISELPTLKVFKIRRSRMDAVKLGTILEALKSISVEHLEFYFCQLDDECGEYIYEYLLSTASLNHFDLSGNYFKDAGIDYIANGIRGSFSELVFLGLSINPIQDENVCNLTNALLTCKQLIHLTLSGVQVSTTGAACVASLVKYHRNLKELEIIAVPMDAYTILDALECNTIIQKMLYQGCGLSVQDEFQIGLLLKRNRYIKENPYIGDFTKTKEEINEFVSRIKNPLLLKALAFMDKRAECIRKRTELVKSPTPSQLSIELAKLRPSFSSTSFNERVELQPRSTELTEEELDERVTLFGQSNINFFKKQNPQKTNQ